LRAFPAPTATRFRLCHHPVVVVDDDSYVHVEQDPYPASAITGETGGDRSRFHRITVKSMSPAQSLVLRLAVLLLSLFVAVSDSAGQSRRELRVGVPGLPAVLDPVTALDGATPLVARHVFDTLVAHREMSTDVEPALATRWTVSRDGLEWTFTLRENVRFHDGTLLNASDVAASFDRHLKADEGHGTPGVVWGPLLRGVPGVVKEVRASNAQTVRITLAQPYAALLSVLAHPGFGIVRRAPGPDGVPRLVGTGAYRVVDVSPGRIAVEAAPGHWTGVPRAPRIVFLEVPDDTHAEAEIDARALDVWLPVTAPRRAENALSAPGLRVGYLAFQTEKEPLSRRPIRQAIASALDPAGIGSALERSAVPLPSFLPPGVWARREGSPVLGGTREAVKKLLADGAWPKAFKPTLLVPAESAPVNLPKLAEALVAMLGAADVPVQLRVEPADVTHAALQAGDYDLALAEATVGAGDPHLFLFPLSTSESAAKGPKALNYSYYRNPRLDDVLIRASQLAFRPERERLYRRAQAMLGAELPWIPLYVQLHWAVVRPEVRGLRLHPSGFHRFHGVSLDPSAVP
jgi:peptide/nickel transport system substrate-binding protein